MISNRTLKSASELVRKSRLFDETYYLNGFSDEEERPSRAIEHYLTVGHLEDRDPSAHFSSIGYARAFGLAPSVNPLLHHIDRCLGLLRENKGFDVGFYLMSNADLVRANIDPAWHFLTTRATDRLRPSELMDAQQLIQEIGYEDQWMSSPPGAANGISLPNNDDQTMTLMAQASAPVEIPFNDETVRQHAALLSESILFDRQYYETHYSDVTQSGLDPLQHYLVYGGFEGRNPHALFNSAWYLNRYSEVYSSGLNPLVHFIQFGAGKGFSPSPHFDTEWYYENNADVRESGLNPLVHYLQYGIHEGRLPKEPRAARPTVGNNLSHYERWLAVNKISQNDKDELLKRLAKFSGKLPTISLITPVYNTEESWLEELVASVRTQLYDQWELCLADDGSPSPHVRPMLERFAAQDARIKVIHLKKNSGISAATNAAAEHASGTVIAFLDHDDLLTPDCLAEIGCYYAEHPEAEIVYSDDDKIDLAGNRYAPQFKPDWSPVLLLSFMYIGHIFSVKRSLFLSLGGFRQPFDGSQDYDFALRAAEVVKHVGHVPKILYHWRAVPGSTAVSGDAKPKSLEAGRLAVEEALRRRGISSAVAHHPRWAEEARVGMFEVSFCDVGPSVCIVIPTKNQLGFLRTCIESLKQTRYKNFEILVIDNESDDPDTVAYLGKIGRVANVTVTRIGNDGGRFSYAALHNTAVKQIKAEYILFLNNDTKVISDIWLSQMMGYAQMPSVGAVGARLYFEDTTIQHAGIVHGYHEGLAGHAFRNLPPHNWGYLGFVRTSREYSGVTAACMLTPRKLFEELGGFDEKNFAVAYNDVDYCYRLVDSGRTCIYCSTAELFHFEGKTRGFKDNPMERANFRRLYGDRIDKWYNPNLSLENEEFQPLARHAASNRNRPIRTVAITHNLNREGAPLVLLDLLAGLQAAGEASVTVISPQDGPLREIFKSHGIRVIVAEKLLFGVSDTATFEVALTAIGTLFSVLEAEVVLANTLQTFWAIAAAARVHIPSLWCQHESEPWQTYYDYLPEYMRGEAYGAFAKPYRVLYVAEATRRVWRELETRGNFEVIRHGIPPERLSAEVKRWTRGTAREALKIPQSDFVFSVLGTICKRKGQLDIVKAFAKLPKAVQQKVRVILVGKIGEAEYGELIENELAKLPSTLAERVSLRDAVDDVFVYYASTDVYACTSLVESAPRVLVEAMACGLPILTTPVFGIPELVIEGVNAEYYTPGDIDGLCELMRSLHSDEKRRSALAAGSMPVLAGQPGYKEMLKGYSRVLREAVNLDC